MPSFPPSGIIGCDNVSGIFGVSYQERAATEPDSLHDVTKS